MPSAAQQRMKTAPVHLVHTVHFVHPPYGRARGPTYASHRQFSKETPMPRAAQQTMKIVPVHLVYTVHFVHPPYGRARRPDLRLPPAILKGIDSTPNNIGRH